MQPVVPSVFDEMEEQRPMYYASTWQRFFNYIIDYIGWYVLLFITGIMLGLITRFTGVDLVTPIADNTSEAKLLQMLLAVVVWQAYYTLFEGATKGLTLGKLITGTKVVTDDGDKITWRMAFKRSLCRLIPFEPFSCFGGHPWHDTMTQTCVVKTR